MAEINWRFCQLRLKNKSYTIGMIFERYYIFFLPRGDFMISQPIQAKTIRAQLLADMKSGIYADCERLPRESVLAEILGISRTQLRDILASLEREGFITRRHGVGTIINRHVLDAQTRIDIEVELPSISYDDLTDAAAPAETSREVRARVMRARAFAALRMQGEKGVFCNAQLDAAGIRKYCKTDEIGGAVLRKAYDRMGLSARGYDRIMRVARTIADLAQSELICAEHIAEAIQLRSLDRKYWGEG